MPAGLPEGQPRLHDREGDRRPRVPAPGRRTGRYAKLPFDPAESEHGTHVAGIAAGDHGTSAHGPNGTVKVSGIAPHAYLGNYRVADDSDRRASASTATRRRSWPASRRRCATG